MDRPRPDWLVLTSPAAGRDSRRQDKRRHITLGRLLPVSSGSHSR